MKKLKELEEAVRQLSPEDRVAFRAWYTGFDAEQWDEQLEADVSAGRLDTLVNEARHDRRTGRCTDR